MRCPVTSQLVGNQLLGWVSNAPIGGSLRFDLPHVGEAVAGASPPVSDTLFPVRRREGGITTGVAIHNLESSAELVCCELLREGVLLDSVSLPLGPNRQMSWLIDAAFTGTEAPEAPEQVGPEAAMDPGALHPGTLADTEASSIEPPDPGPAGRAAPSHRWPASPAPNLKPGTP